MFPGFYATKAERGGLGWNEANHGVGCESVRSDFLGALRRDGLVVSSVSVVVGVSSSMLLLAS